jgi:protein ImuB
LEEGRVLERFGTDGVHCHRVARGNEGELVGLRDLTISARLGFLDEPPPPPVQPSFFGGTSLAAERATKAAIRLQRKIGTTSVSVARLRCGHDPGERAELVPFGAPEGRPVSSDPWPGALPAPSPAAVLTRPLGCRLSDAQGAPVEVTTHGLLSARPTRCTIEGEARTLAVRAWAGPWPVAARWWERRATRARLQVVTEEGVGLLLSSERGAWHLVGRYD